MTQDTNEFSHLNKFSTTYTSESGQINEDINSHNVVELIKTKGFIGGTAIQMGLGDGYVAKHLVNLYDQLIVIEGSIEVINRHYSSAAGYEIVHSLFEEYTPLSKCDWLLGNHILEHVEDPVEVLSKTRKWMKENAKAIFTVPNATSLHRRIGVEMKLLKYLHEFNQQDIDLGHRRVYNVYEFAQDIRSSGYEILETSGYMVKLVSNKQMKGWSRELLDAIFKVSLSLPAEICSNICVICKP